VEHVKCVKFNTNFLTVYDIKLDGFTTVFIIKIY